MKMWWGGLKSHSQEVFDNMKNDLQAIIAFLESKDFEDAVRNAVSLGGDTDTLEPLQEVLQKGCFKADSRKPEGRNLCI